MDLNRKNGNQKKAYRGHLVDFEFLRDLDTTVIPIFEINLVKLDYAQTRLDEIIQYEKKVIVQAERNRLSVNGEMKAQK